jgi:hypothetical protein
MRRNDSAQARIGRATSRPDAMKAAQIKFRLPTYLRDLIHESGEQNGWGDSEEMRRRLEASFVEEAQAGDDETYRLVRAIQTVAINVRPAFGHWHEDRFAFDTFRAAVLALIDLHRPPGMPVRPKDNEIADSYLGEDGTPETAGRMIAGGAAVAAGIPVPGMLKKKIHIARRKGK